MQLVIIVQEIILALAIRNFHVMIYLQFCDIRRHVYVVRIQYHDCMTNHQASSS